MQHFVIGRMRIRAQQVRNNNSNIKMHKQNYQKYFSWDLSIANHVISARIMCDDVALRTPTMADKLAGTRGRLQTRTKV